MSTMRGNVRELRWTCWLIGSVVVVAFALDVCSARYVPMRYDSRRSPMLMRRQDSGDSDQDDDEETLDSHASSPYQQNQDEGNGGDGGGGGANDGYDDPEPDGPYEETPKEREGQADLERFFDDHLGASERDGMDKENLPTELAYQLMEPPEEKQTPNDRRSLLASQTVQTSFLQLPDQRLIITRQITHDTADKPDEDGRAAAVSPRTEVEMQLLMSRQRARPPQGPQIAFLQPEQRQSAPDQMNSEAPLANGHARDGLDARASDIVWVDNEHDEGRVYITNATNRPFRIDALGGYDPEEDFIDASRDIEGRQKGRQQPGDDAANSRGGQLSAENALDETEADDRPRPAGGGRPGRRRAPEQLSPAASSDISFNDDPEGEDLFEDASETDEVTFAHEDPYQTDLEAEMRRQAFDKVGQFNADDPRPLWLAKATGKHRASFAPEISGNGDASTNRDFVPATDGEEQQPETSASTSGLARRGAGKPASSDRDYDDDESGWVNDGVEDMDIPSQSHQNEVLEKAAKREEAKKRADEDEEAAAAAMAATSPDSESEVEATNKPPPSEQQPGLSSNSPNETPTSSDDGAGDDQENQRMPNADYLKGDLREFDDSAYRAAA